MKYINLPPHEGALPEVELRINGELAVIGQEVTTSRGEKATLIGWRKPHKISSSGRVNIMFEGTDCEMEYYPSVINGEFKEVKDEVKEV